MVVITPPRAPVSARALSTTSCRTVSTSRLALMRRIAAVSLAVRSRNAWFSRLMASKSFNGPLPASYGAKPLSGVAAQGRDGYAGFAMHGAARGAHSAITSPIYTITT